VSRPAFWPDPLTLAEPLADGRFRCRTCQATWWPMLDGRLEPTRGSWLCPHGCGQKPGVRQATPPALTAPGPRTRERR